MTRCPSPCRRQPRGRSDHPQATPGAPVPVVLAHYPVADRDVARKKERSVATRRLLRAEDGRQLPVSRVFGIEPPAGQSVAELARPATRRPKDQRLLLSLIRAGYDEALAAEIDQLYLVADQALLTLLRALGFRFRAVAGPMWAYGAWNLATVLEVDEVLPGLRMHQDVHGCRIADYFAAPFDGSVPAAEICPPAG